MTAPDKALDEYMEEILSGGGGETMTARVAALPLWQRRLLAVGLALLVLGSVLVVLGRPLWQLQVTNAERVEALEFELRRFQAAAAARPELERRRAELRAMQDRGGYLSGNRPTLAAADLQRLVRSAVANARGTLVSTQVLPAESVEGFQRINLRIRVRGDVEMLRSVLYRLEAGTPYLLVDNLRIRVWTVGRRQGGIEAGDLDVYFDVYGYLVNGEVS